MQMMNNVKAGDWIEIYVSDSGVHLVGSDNSKDKTALVKVLRVTPTELMYAYNEDSKLASIYTGKIKDNINFLNGVVSNKDDLEKFKYYRSCGTHCYFKPAKAPYQPNEFWGMVKSDLNQAAYRSGATQLSKATKNGILALMRKSDSENVEAAAKLLDSELGEAFISLFIGYTLTYAPVISEDGRVKNLAKECRTGAMSTGMNVAFESIMSTIYPAIKDAINSIPIGEPEEKPVTA